MAWLLFIALIILIAIAVAAVAVKRKSRSSSKASEFPYVKQDTLLTDAERSFLGVLEQAAGDRFRIYAQVRLADLLAVKSGTDKSRRASAQNKINSKHADFVLCNSKTLEIVCAIELDDSSHQKASRKDRDAFLEMACATAGLPLAKFPAKSGYVVAEVRAEIYALLGIEVEAENQPAPRIVASAAASSALTSAAPACPKCGSETVLRAVKSGAHAGSKLWGCKNYPGCKGYIPAGT